LKIIGDFHIHSKFSRATSPNLDLESLSASARIKGLDLLGTGDITHPKWFAEISKELETTGSGFYKLKDKQDEPKFVPTTEVATVFEKGGKSRKVHHCIILPNLEVAEQFSDSIKHNGHLESDGRPTLNMTATELVGIVKRLSDDAEVYPAHAWTPWWSVFGANFGFDSIAECYEDYASKINALETGLSSDPPMNWRLSSLDRLTLLSNSDCHSAYPYRLGREANILELEEFDYPSLLDAIRRKGSSRVIATIETKPEYGKYHWTGHRNCGVSFSTEESRKLGGRCPKCGRKLTRGVEERVLELADREEGFKPTTAADYVYAYPLQELIAAVIDEQNPLSKRVQQVYDKAIATFDNEFNITLNAPIEDLKEVLGKEIASLVKAIRDDTAKVIAGYDGVYGRLKLNNDKEEKKLPTKNGLDYWT
jgi:uncharacterized protein (TIGR00375 family)